MEKIMDIIIIILAIILYFIMRANNNLIEFIAYILIMIFMQIINIKNKI